MLSYDPLFLINGGDMGITAEATSFYTDRTRDLPIPLFMCNGNHEMCSGYLPRDKAGTMNTSVDSGGVHLIILDVVRYHEPTDDHLLTWLECDLSQTDPQAPVFVTSHIPFSHVATLHGHDHENCRHYRDHIEIMTTAAVAGNWWRNGWDSRCSHSREPQGFRIIEVAECGAITSRYVPFVPEQDGPAEVFLHAGSGRRFVNVFDGSPKTLVTSADLGPLPIIDPYAASSLGLSAHLYEFPHGYDRGQVDVRIDFENRLSYDVGIPLASDYNGAY